MDKLIQKLNIDDNKTKRLELITEINRLKDSNPKGVQRTNHGGWHSQNLCSNDKFNVLNGVIINYINRDIFKNKLRIGSFEKSWIIINNKGHYNSRHNHGRNTISGCFYFSAPADSGDIIFSSDKEIRITPENGDLLIFPGQLKHSVDVNNTEQDRIVYSFNIESYNVVGSDNIFKKTLREWEENDK